MGIIDNFEAMLARGQDSALLRFSLGTEYAKTDDHERAVTNMREAVRLDPGYSAAYKQLGKSLAALGQHQEAVAAFDLGIPAAEAKGDMQAAREMQVFRKRALKAGGA